MPPKYSQHYRSEWEQMLDFKDWLQPVEDDTTKAYCKYCKCEMIAKVHCLKLHILSIKHKKAIEPVKSQRTINFPKVKKDLNTQRAESSLAMFVCAHCSIMAVDHLSDLCKHRFGDSKSGALRVHRTKCTNIIKNVLAPHFIEEIVSDLGDQEYSLLLDESTDISVSKMLGVSIRYFSRSLKTIISTFLGLVEIEDGTANSIVNGIKGLLLVLNIEIKKMIGIGTDNATVMTGTNNGVHALLKNETGNDNLVLVRCVCHSLQLALSHASEETLPRNVEFLIRETYNWFSHSSNRRLYYKNIYQTINCGSEPLLIPQMCNTRWISIEPAVSRILEQWVELKLLFEVARRDNHCYMAETLYSMYNDPVNHLYLLYLKPILEEVQTVNKLFESNNIDPTKLYKDLCALVQSTSRRILNPTARVDIFTQNIESYLDPKPYMGYAFETKLREYNLQPEVENNLRRRCLNFTLKLVSELRSRLPINFKILEKVSLFSVEETLKAVKPSLSDIAQEFRVDAATMDRLMSQWRNIVHIKWERTSSTVEFWNEVIDYKDAADSPCWQHWSCLLSVVSPLKLSRHITDRTRFSMAEVVVHNVKVSLVTEVNSPEYDAVVVVTQPGVPPVQALEDFIAAAVQLDQGLEKHCAVLSCPRVSGGRLVLSPTGPLTPYDDVRSVYEAALAGVRRAAAAGARRPVLALRPAPAWPRAALVTLLGALEALYVPLQIRESFPAQAQQPAALGVYGEGVAALAALLADAGALEAARGVSRDIGGADPERMTPRAVAEYVRGAFGPSVRVRVMDDAREIAANYPLFEAVNRCANGVDRHKGCVIFLDYEPKSYEQTVMLVGKGVTYDTGGCDIKAGGVMAGMSRDKCGAAAVAGFLKACELLQPPLKVCAALCMVRNSVGSEAYVADELIRSRRGLAVRVGNTDAEGRMVMADVLDEMRERAEKEKNPHLYTVATLTGHAVRAYGEGYSIVMDNHAARALGHAEAFRAAGDSVGDMVEVSTIRREDLLAHRGRVPGDHVHQAASLPSTAMPRGHQGPAGFLLLTAGLAAGALPYSHLDVAASAGSLPAPPTAAPLLALAAHYKLIKS